MTLVASAPFAECMVDIRNLGVSVKLSPFHKHALMYVRSRYDIFPNPTSQG